MPKLRALFDVFASFSRAPGSIRRASQRQCENRKLCGACLRIATQKHRKKQVTTRFLENSTRICIAPVAVH
jgi:hypothetical protein